MSTQITTLTVEVEGISKREQEVLAEILNDARLSVERLASAARKWVGLPEETREAIVKQTNPSLRDFWGKLTRVGEGLLQDVVALGGDTEHLGRGAANGIQEGDAGEQGTLTGGGLELPGELAFGIVERLWVGSFAPLPLRVMEELVHHAPFLVLVNAGLRFPADVLQGAGGGVLAWIGAGETEVRQIYQRRSKAATVC